MGVDYYNCAHCNEVFADCGETHTFEIRGIGSYYVCGNCISDVQSLLTAAELPDYYYVAKAIYNREVFRDEKEMLKFYQEHKDVHYEYSIYKETRFPQILQDAWTNKKQNGFTKVDQLKDLTFTNRYSSDRMRRISLAWKGWSYMSKGFMDIRETKKITKYFCDCDSKDKVMKEIRQFIDQNNLNGVPFQHTEDQFSEKDLEFWAFPDNYPERFSQWFKDPEELIKTRWDDIDVGDVEEWLPTKDFLQPRLDKISSKIKKLQKERKELEALLKKAEEKKDEDMEEDEEESDNTEVTKKSKV